MTAEEKLYWQVLRHVVTHNHQRPTFELLLADIQEHFQTLTHISEDVRHIGSPLAPENMLLSREIALHD